MYSPVSGFLATPLGLHGTFALDAFTALAVTLVVSLSTRLLSLR